ncbi:MAG: 5'-nucleotidase C-terminal domain-containing protein [Candidatus Cryptobacteroides sp.]|nr:5'-nucleotidase C-terminal domain-containing protein [Bacteroidales bacterium]MDD6052367.1 5'-nucleotidase [Bacteroidales bacterium]
MRRFLTILFLVSLCMGAAARDFSWKRVRVDGSVTGVKAADAGNVSEALGYMDGRCYVAPDGRRYRRGATARTAALLLGAQDRMKDLKTVIAYAPEDMVKAYPESSLSNWFVDTLMDSVSVRSGKKVHFGIVNFGGIRVDIAAGNVLKDDIVSMFPFKNNLCYLELKGRDIRALLEKMAAGQWQVIGGVRCVAKDGKLLSATIDGQELDDDLSYGVATISFLLNGGDGLNVARNSTGLEIYDDYVLDVMLPHVEQLTREGRELKYSTDGRIRILD